MTNTDRIREAIEKLFSDATKQGHGNVEIVSGWLHDQVDFRSGSHPNQMPSVCNVMHEFFGTGDTVLHETASGKSSTLKIRYRIPR